MEKIIKKKGRPRKNTMQLPGYWQKEILELYEDGASDMEIKALLFKWMGKFCDQVWKRWMQENDDFSQTIKRGRELSQAWWEKQGRVNLEKKEFNPTLWYMNMRNRFGWADNQKIDHTTQGEKINITLTRG